MKKAYLEITTWKGTFVWYADHYYGSLRFGDERIDVNCKPTGGDEPCGFTDEEKLVKSATELFKQDSHGYEILIKGSSHVCFPQKILVGPSEIKAEANGLYNQYVNHEGGWNHEMKNIFEKWDSIVGPVWENE